MSLYASAGASCPFHIYIYINGNVPYCFELGRREGFNLECLSGCGVITIKLPLLVYSDSACS